MIRILKISSGSQGFPGFKKDLVDLWDFQKISGIYFGFLCKVYEISARDTPLGRIESKYQTTYLQLQK